MEVEREAARGRVMERKGEECNKQVQLRMHRKEGGDKQVWHEREMRQVLADCWGDSEAEGAWQVCGGRRPPSCNTPHLETLHYLHFTIYTESSTSLHA